MPTNEPGPIGGQDPVDMLMGGNDAADAVTIRAFLAGGSNLSDIIAMVDPETTILGSVTAAADKVPYFTSASAASTFTVTAAARTVLDDTTVTAMLDTIIAGASTAVGRALLTKSASAAYTQTYATAARTHSDLTSTDVVAVDATDDATVWALANEIKADFNALRADVINLKQVVNALIDDQQALGLTT